MEEKIKEVVELYFRFINEEKFDEFFALFDDDVVFQAPFGFNANGIEKVKPFYLGVPRNYPDHTDTPEEIFISGNKAAVFIDFKGKDAKGNPTAFKASDWFVIENGKIKKLNIFYDSFALHKERKKS